jgi:hypothetical protein
MKEQTFILKFVGVQHSSGRFKLLWAFLTLSGSRDRRVTVANRPKLCSRQKEPSFATFHLRESAEAAYFLNAILRISS